MELQVNQIRHPYYRENVEDWRKYRLTYAGGDAFKLAYLKQYTKRETAAEFVDRKSMTYCPRFAGAAIDDVKNSIYQRMADIARVGADQTYQEAILGKNGGVDKMGATMNFFIGQSILPELLTMSRVGVLVDMPPLEGFTKLANKGLKPYLYYYCAEDICSWSGSYVDNQMLYTSLLIRDNTEDCDKDSGLVTKKKVSWRHYKLTPEGVVVKFYKTNGELINEQLLELTRIPFVLFDIKRSLLQDIADYQIALLNLESSDIAYALRSNFPIYVEEFDPRTQNINAKPNSTELADDPILKRKERVVGNSSGRQYPMGANPPAFIHPSPEPLQAAMAKEAQIKQDIRKLLNLSLSSIEPTLASAESKGHDEKSLESGLSAIGQILENGERQISVLWKEYMTGEAATIQYPRNYSLKSENERREESKSDAELMSIVPSRTYQKQVAVKIANNLIGHQVSYETMEMIKKEILEAKYISSDAEDIAKDMENGIVCDVTASNARGYDGEKEVPQAQKDRAERIKITQAAQTSPEQNTSARGLTDLNPEHGNKGARQEKDGAANK